MSDGTAIQWTDATWNPIRARDSAGTTGWHCERVSPGCQHCYAERLNEKRFGTGLPYNRKSRDLVEVYLDEKALTQPLHWRRPRKVFAGSMTDLFGAWVPDEMIDRVFAVMALSPQHTYQVLTKRPERMREYVGSEFEERADAIGEAMTAMTGRLVSGDPADDSMDGLSWPLANVWLGTSVEYQEQADQRIPELLALPAAVRFLSCEPLLGPVDFKPAFQKVYTGGGVDSIMAGHTKHPRLDWVIVGGESGPNARTTDIAHIRSIVRQCQVAGVAVFVKQLGSKPVDANDGSPVMSLPVSIGDYPGKRLYNLRDRKGGDLSEWPADLRVREFPR